MMTHTSLDSQLLSEANVARSQNHPILIEPVPWVPACWVVRAARLMSSIGVAFLLFDVSLKLLQVPAALEASAQLGFGTEAVFTIGMIQVICLIAYLIPRTRLLGALLWTGYLGGAIATHLRVGSPLFSHVLFPAYVALLLWAYPWVSDARLRSMLLDGPGSVRREPNRVRSTP